MASGTGPQSLRQALAQLIALRGYARVQGNADLQTAWKTVAGELFGRFSRAVAIRRSVLHVGVASAPLLSELTGYHKQTLLSALQTQFAHLRIRDIKFKLDSDIREAAQQHE